MPAVSNTVGFIVNQMLFDLTLLFEDLKKIEKCVCGEKEGEEGEGGGS